MKDNQKTIRRIAVAFVALFLLSLYRQYGRMNGGQDPQSVWIVYAGYMVLLGSWWILIYRRISQRNLRHYISVEIVVMAFWLLIRALQDSIFVEDQVMLRASGYLIAFPLMLLPLFGLYGVLGLDKGPEYRMNPMWYWLQIPAAILIMLMLTNETHHIIFLKEAEINVQFRWNWGITFIILWSIALVAARLLLLAAKSWRNRDYPCLRFLPFVIGILTLGMYGYYLLHSFNVQNEVVELTAKHYFMEMLLWESCIGLGMVPVNLQYEQVFRESTVAMQITDHSGHRLAASGYAPEVTPAAFAELQEFGQLSSGEGRELRLYDFGDGCLIWQRDFSAINELYRQLQQTAEELQQEGTLLQEELATRSEETRLQAKDEIFNSLAGEVDGELQMLDELLEDAPDTRQWQIIGLLGTYVKRLCNLRLIYEDAGMLETADLKTSVSNLMDWVKKLCPGAALTFQPQPNLAPEMCFLSLKVPICLLESAAFAPERFTVSIGEDLVVSIGVPGDYRIPTEQIDQLLGKEYTALWKSAQGNLQLTIRKEAVSDGEQG